MPQLPFAPVRQFHSPETVAALIESAGFKQVAIRKFLNGAVCMHIRKAVVLEASMRGFSSSFLIFFYQVALGGLFALAATPFQELDRAFYKSTGGVLCLIAILGLWGKSSFYNHYLSTEFSWIVAAELVFHSYLYFSVCCFLVGRAARSAFTVFAGAILESGGLVLSAHSFLASILR